jgi:hypothetical protein
MRANCLGFLKNPGFAKQKILDCGHLMRQPLHIAKSLFVSRARGRSVSYPTSNETLDFPNNEAYEVGCGPSVNAYRTAHNASTPYLPYLQLQGGRGQREKRDLKELGRHFVSYVCQVIDF